MVGKTTTTGLCEMEYVGSPYTGNEEANYQIALYETQKLLCDGVIAYSPIVHCHPMAIAFDMPGDFSFWKKYNLGMLRIASSMIVLKAPGWDLSRGLEKEISFAYEAGIPITYIEVDFTQQDKPNV